MQNGHLKQETNQIWVFYHSLSTKQNKTKTQRPVKRKESAIILGTKIETWLQESRVYKVNKKVLCSSIWQ